MAFNRTPENGIIYKVVKQLFDTRNIFDQSKNQAGRILVTLSS